MNNVEHFVMKNSSVCWSCQKEDLRLEVNFATCFEKARYRGKVVQLSNGPMEPVFPLLLELPLGWTLSAWSNCNRMCWKSISSHKTFLCKMGDCWCLQRQVSNKKIPPTVTWLDPWIPWCLWRRLIYNTDPATCGLQDDITNFYIRIISTAG